MIEFRSFKRNRGPRVELVVDGEAIPPAKARVRPSRTGDREMTEVVVDDPVVASRLTEHSPGEIPDKVKRIDLAGGEYWLGDFRATFVLRRMRNDFILQCQVYLDIDTWNRRWSIKEFLSQLAEGCKDNPFIEVGGVQRNLGPLSGEVPLVQCIQRISSRSPCRATSSIDEQIQELVPILHSAIEDTEIRLRAMESPDSITIPFSFPQEVRAPCEQYLVYFVEFLADLGIEARADLTHETAGVMFAVTPKSGREALAKVWEALGVYLKLPTRPQHLNAMDVTSHPHVQALAAQIQHFNSQLMFANAALRLKDATIEQQAATIDLQRRALSGQVLIDSVQSPAGPDASGNQEIVPGILAVKPYEGDWIRLDLPEIIRRLRRRFWGDESGSSGPPALPGSGP